MKRKIFFIAFSITIMIVLVSYMAISNHEVSQKSFVKAGYIIDNKESSSGNKSTVYYFDEDTKYRSRYDGNIVFKDVNGDSVNIDAASAIHYDDESIAVLKKSVIFDLEQVDNELPIYYNIFNDSIMEYSNGTYTIDNLGKKLKFKNFIIRVSDTKFLIVASNMVLNFDGKDISVNSNYVELNFIDDKVVTIENKDSKYQTISKEAKIDFGSGLYLNLDNRYIYADGVAKISIDQMIIDSSDNIDIQPLETEEEEEDSLNGGPGGNGSSDEVVVEEGDSVGIDIVETEIQESKLSLPYADISDLDITANKVEGTIKISDKDAIVHGDIVTKIIENSTGKVVDIVETAEGSYNVEISSDRLSPETTYNLVTTISYRKNGIDYTMDVVQYVFVTSALGVEIEKDYYTFNSLSFNVIFDSYSKAKSCNVTLYNSVGEALDSYIVTRTTGVENVVFPNLSSNTKYQVVLNNILYEDYIVSDDYAIELSAKTLKSRPSIGTPSFLIDKKSSKFTLNLENMSDPENGVEGYRYEVFDTRTMAQTNTPVSIFEKTYLGSVDMEINESTIHRGIGYVFRVVIEFYDNEKYIEYYTPYSEVMQIDGTAPPTLSWKTNKVTFESIDGIISISDPGQMIDFSKEMTVVYTNSIGTSISYPTGGNSIIPFKKTGLRAKETYTISIYGTMDFRDGNGVLENYHIGSVIVYTNETNPIPASYSQDSSNIDSAFSVTARLLNSATADNTLEASTLTGITFILHEGETTAGRVVKTRKFVDSNSEIYESDLKTQFYDNEFTIDPSFFNMNNSDATAEFYTIEITSAYDYTKFPNYFTIKNNTVTVKSSGFAPDLPDDINNAVSFTRIRNKDYKTYDDELDALTFVGLKFMSTFDNSKRYARVFHYTFYDADDCVTDPDTEVTTCTEIFTLDYDVPSDGVIEELFLPIGYGTDLSTNDYDFDTDDRDINSDIIRLRRGHRYYVSYYAGLDLNKDGIVETRYPKNENIILRSKIIEIPKQEADVGMYPSRTTKNSYTFKYSFKDVDHTFSDNRLWGASGTSLNNLTRSLGFVPIDTTFSTDDDGNVVETLGSETFSNIPTQSYLGIYGMRKLYKSDDVEEKYFIKQYFYGSYTLPNLTYQLAKADNRIVIYFNDYLDMNPAYSRIAAVDLYFTATIDGEERTITKKGVSIDSNGSNGYITVNLFDINEFKGHEVTLAIEAYYDTELFGFDISSNFYALQSIISSESNGEYFIMDSGETIIPSSTSANGSIFRYTHTNSTLTFKNYNATKTANIPVNFDAGGMVYNHTHYAPKKLEKATINPEKESYRTFNFNKIIPGISVLDTDGNTRIIPLMASVNVGARVYGFDLGASSVWNDLIFVKTYKILDDAGVERELLFTKEYSTNDLNGGVEIKGLYPSTAYSLEFWAYVCTDSADEDGNGVIDESERAANCEFSQLSDVDDYAEGSSKSYDFTTLSGVTFSKWGYKYTAASYDTKSITFSYTIDKTIGFDKIGYTFLKREYNAQERRYVYEPIAGYSIEPSSMFQTNMKVIISAGPGETPFAFNGSSYYKIIATPYVIVETDSGTQEIELTNSGGEMIFRPSLTSPYANIRTSYVYGELEDGTIDYRVTFFDKDRLVVDDEYTVQFLDDDGFDITPEEYVGQTYSTMTSNLLFRLSNVPIEHQYELVIKYSLDRYNNGRGQDAQVTKAVSLYSSTSIRVGNITALANSLNPNRIDLRFSDSYQLTDIDQLSYSIYNSSDGSSLDNIIDFSPRAISVSGSSTIYVVSLPDSLPSEGTYYIQLQFSSEGEIVYEGTVEYVYIES